MSIAKALIPTIKKTNLHFHLTAEDACLHKTRRYINNVMAIHNLMRVEESLILYHNEIVTQTHDESTTIFSSVTGLKELIKERMENHESLYTDDIVIVGNEKLFNIVKKYIHSVTIDESTSIATEPLDTFEKVVSAVGDVAYLKRNKGSLTLPDLFDSVRYVKTIQTMTSLDDLVPEAVTIMLDGRVIGYIKPEKGDITINDYDNSILAETKKALMSEAKVMSMRQEIPLYDRASLMSPDEWIN